MGLLRQMPPPFAAVRSRPAAVAPPPVATPATVLRSPAGPVRSVAPPPVHWPGGARPLQQKPGVPAAGIAPPPVHWPGGARPAQAKPAVAAPTPPPRPGFSGPPPIRPSVRPPPAGGARASTLQAMNDSGGLPMDLTGYTTMSWKKHQKMVAEGHDQIGLRVYELNQGITRADQATALIIPTSDIAFRSDTDHALLSIENLEQQSWTVTRRINKRVNEGKSVSSDMAKQTEVIGETAAYNAIAKRYPDYTLAFAADPGHGGGIDQLWIKTNLATGGVHTYFIVEAKGPKAKLNQSAFSIAQMSKTWVEKRLKTLSNNTDPQVSGPAKAAAKAIKKKGNGNTVPYVDGAVYTARWHNHKLTHSVSKKKRYN